MTSRFVLGAALALATSTGAFAQSLIAPAGMPSTVAPGGLEGRSALASEDRSTVSGYAGARDDGPATGSVRTVREHTAHRQPRAQ